MLTGCEVTNHLRKKAYEPVSSIISNITDPDELEYIIRAIENNMDEYYTYTYDSIYAFVKWRSILDDEGNSYIPNKEEIKQTSKECTLADVHLQKMEELKVEAHIRLAKVLNEL